MTMTDSEALERAVRRTGFERYRTLVDPAHPDHDPRAPAVVRRLAALPLPGEVVPGEAPCRCGAKETRPALTVKSYLAAGTGYGQIAEWLGRELEERGHPVVFTAIHQDDRFLPIPPFVADRTRDRPCPGVPVLSVAVPSTPPPVAGEPWCAVSMWEASRIEVSAVVALNYARVVVVPCAWNAEGFRASGVTAPIRVVPLGVDAAEGYAERPWREGRPFTIGMAARMAHGGIRKGINEGMRAFVRAFDKGEDVRLRVKVFDDCLRALKVPPDPRITVVTTPMRPTEMAGWYADLDVLLVPSKAEGWGLHTAQALAVGRPVVASLYGGTAEFVTEACSYPLDFAEGPAGEFYGGCGSWAVPSEASMVARLREAYRAPEGVRRKGAAGAERMRQFPWSRTGAELEGVLKEFGLLTA